MIQVGKFKSWFSILASWFSCLGFILESLEVSKTMLMPGLHPRPIKSGDMTQTLLVGGVFWVFLLPT